MPHEPNTHATHHIETRDARRLAYSEYGAPDGAPLIYHHGFPSSRREAALLHETASAAGARIIAPDRPGYGDSDDAPQRRLIDWAGDVEQLSDHLKLEQFGLIGVSGGGPYALACAHHLSRHQPERLGGCALVCPLGPIYIDELLHQMNWAARANLAVGKQPRWIADLIFGGPTPALLHHWPQLVEDMRSIAAPPADRALLGDRDIAGILNQTIADAMQNSAKGARRDLMLYTHDWHIPFAAIEHPVHIWHGLADGTVPVEHARWLAQQLPHSELTELPGEGHYSVPIRYARQILDALLAAA